MKTAFAAAIALSLLSGTAAMAAPNDMHAGQNQSQGHTNQGHSNQGHGNQGHGNQPQMAPKPNQQANNKPVQQPVQKPAQQSASQNWGGTHNNGQANNQTRGNDNRNAPRQYSYNGRSYRAVAAPAWSAPRGYINARRDWNRGERLPSAYRDRAYVIDYRAYGLMRPPYGYQWVRVSNNVYLVNAQNGFITQIVFSMFY